MKRIIALEELFLFFLGGWALFQMNADWWVYLLMLLGPDIGMVGYLAGARVGAVSYNIFHHRAVSVALFMMGWYWHSDVLSLAGIIIFGHSAMDRALGYGLKYFRGFQYTHLGLIGKQKTNTE